MKKFVILTDSCSDLSKDLRDKYDIDYIQMHINVDENEYMADVDSDAEFKGDTNVVSDGYFHESEMRSAPYFDLDIDGITIK
jgi:hypothetical protein